MPSNAIPPNFDSFDSGYTGTRSVYAGGFSITPGRIRESATGVDNAGGRGEVHNDQYSEVTVATFTTGAKLGPMVRLSGGMVGYFLFAEQSTATLWLYRVPAFNLITSVAYTFPAVPFKMRLEVIGSTLYSYIDGDQALPPTVDTNIATGSPGYYITGATSVANQEIEDFECGPLPAGSYSPRQHPQASAQPLPDRVYRMR